MNLKQKFILSVALLLTVLGCRAQTAALHDSHALYHPKDSALVEALLSERPAENDVLFYARKFLGRPYVAHTLEVADPEQLVVNLRELDCTTLVETVCALSLTQRRGGKTFADYLQSLEHIRYRSGRMDGYLSRLHYFAWWMHDNIRKGAVEEVTDERLFTAPLSINNYYMSRNAVKYKMLRLHPEWSDSIRRMEARENGADGTFLPEAATALPRERLSVVQNGDIIAIVTHKKGLDYSHLGFAYWGKDGKLHMLHASSIYKRVIEDPLPLYDYLKKQQSAVGIRVLRLK